MSVRLTLPLKRALTGPIFTLTAACSSVSESFSRLSQPGMEARNVSASLSRAHTVARSAGSTNSPDIVTAMAHLSLEPSSPLRPVLAATVLPRPSAWGRALPASEPRQRSASRDIIVSGQYLRQRTKLGLMRATRSSPWRFNGALAIGSQAQRAGSCALALGLHLRRAPVQIGADELDQVVDPVLEEVVGLR